MKFKRLIAIYAAICVFFNVPAVFAQDEYMSRGEVADFLLCAADDYNKGLVRSDIIKGYDDGNLYEERLVTRAEALVMLHRAFGTLPECKGHHGRKKSLRMFLTEELQGEWETEFFHLTHT